MGADLGTYIGTSGPDNKFGNYSVMKGKGGGDILTSSLDTSGFVKIYGNGGGDELTYVGLGQAELWGGNGPDQLYGGLQNDKLFGGKGDDWLFGYFGNDILKGNGGNDHFGFNTAPDSKDNKDDIRDFQLNKDLLHFNISEFVAFNYTGQLKKKHFEKGKKAGDGNDYLGYDKKTGTIWYDPNGSDPGGKEKVACVDEGLNLNVKHFMLDF